MTTYNKDGAHHLGAIPGRDGRWVLDVDATGDVRLVPATSSPRSSASSPHVAIHGSAEAEETAWWAPGFTDIQVNGYGGVDYSGGELTADDIRSVIAALAAAGTTMHVPTIITNSQERICRNLETLAGAIESDGTIAAAIGGIHVEGPYISAEDGPRGAHDVAYVRDPDWNEVSEWIAASRGHLRVVTLAPERSGAIRLIERLRAEGIAVAIGHTAATTADIRRAVAAGASLSTHLGNGSHAMLPRLDNYLWAQLAADDLTAGLITDGFHLPPPVMSTMYRAKGADRILLVSDAAPFAGLPPGTKSWGNITVEIYDDGHIGLAGTPFLAGAGHLLDRCIAQAVLHTEMSLAEAIRSASEIPARFIARQSIPVLGGDPAQWRSFVRFLWASGMNELRVTHTVRDNQIIFSREEVAT